MSLSDGLYSALTGGQKQSTESFSRFLKEMKATHGSRRAAARAAGVSESTWRRWEKGAKPKADNRGKIMKAGRENRLSPDGPTDRSVRVKTTDAGTQRNRTLDASALKITPGTMDRVRQAMISGDANGMANAFVGGVGSDWYRNYIKEGDDRVRRVQEARISGRTRRAGRPTDMPERSMTPDSTIRPDGSEAKGTHLEELEDKAAEIGMGGMDIQGEGIEGEEFDWVDENEYEPDSVDDLDDTSPIAGSFGVTS